MSSFKSLNFKTLKFAHGFLVVWLLLSPFLAIAPLAPKTAEAAILNRSLSVPANNLGLVGWWTFDGPDMTPNVRDRSGQGNHGNLTNQTSTSSIPGKIGQSLQFDGLDDYISYGNDLGLSDYPVTISAWVKKNSTSNADALFLGLSSDNNRYLSLGYRSGFVMDARYNTGTANGEITSAVIADKDWHHLVGVWTSATNRELYVDGINRGTDTDSLAYPDANSFEIGRNGGSTPFNHWDGAIDDARIYNRALSASEISRLYETSSASYSTSRSPGTLSSGLVGHWTFDGKNMTPNVRDSSGQGNHGNLASFTSTTTVAGKVGQGLLFDRDDQVLLPDLVDGLSTMTISVWFKANIGDDGHIRLAYEDGSLDFRRYSTDRFYFELTNASAATASSFSDTLYADTEWHHVVGTFDGSVIDLYVDGVDDEASTVSLSGPIATSGGNFSIGNASSGANGTIDDMRLYNRVLSADEIEQLYRMGEGTKFNASPEAKLTSGLVGYWTFDGNDMNWSTNQALDKSGQGNNGTLTNMSTSSSPIGGKIGQALSFDGVDDEITRSSAVSSATNNITMSVWIYYRSSDDNGLVIYNGDQSTNGYGIMISNGSCGSGTQIVIQLGGTSCDAINTASPAITANTWTHIAVTRESSTWRMYKDGVLLSGTSTTNPSAPSGEFQIGDPDMSAVIDEARFYTRALSASEIKQLYNMGR